MLVLSRGRCEKLLLELESVLGLVDLSWAQVGENKVGARVIKVVTLFIKIGALIIRDELKVWILRRGREIKRGNLMGN